ncbi:MrpF/PhaF family protein [Streptomyces actinomycinicus]|uniref:MrpF/PhaF family protein n=1 Tax=Streptomyces actinomycinicus TaxID=1695166 RepID=A0A937EL38_9ACTN|nr:MrpF/PhaF family protein [Streptomyces actinomycinicus]MBL1084458.1 MrpF/PhaF family protein [Streptomyces actinomycinicus]
MNGWILAATVGLGGGGAAALWGVTTGSPGRRVIAQNLTTSAVCPALLLLSQGYGRPAYVDLALLMALLGPVGTLVFARLLADDLADERPSAWGLTWAAAGLAAAVVIALCVAGGPGRAMVKLLVIGALLIGGNVIASRALAGGFREVRGG